MKFLILLGAIAVTLGKVTTIAGSRGNYVTKRSLYLANFVRSRPELGAKFVRSWARKFVWAEMKIARSRRRGVRTKKDELRTYVPSETKFVRRRYEVGSLEVRTKIVSKLTDWAQWGATALYARISLQLEYGKSAIHRELWRCLASTNGRECFSLAAYRYNFIH